MSFSIGDYQIGKDFRPFIIAEMSGNHNGSLERAIRLVEAAAKAGAHAIKLQTYTPDTMTLNIKTGKFFIDDSQSLWKGRSLHELYKDAMTPWEWHKPIFDRCKELGMCSFSTPFDATAVDFLESLGVPACKVASFENNDLPLIRKIASLGKPMFISTGMASIAELDELIQTVRTAGCQDIVLLKCTSAYPASPRDSNLKTLPHLRELFGTEVGLSDHTLGIGVALASIAFGSTVIEKHFTLSRADGGVDSVFSLEPDELRALVSESERAWEALGEIKYGPSGEREKLSLQYRRSLYVAEDMAKGETFSRKNLHSIRPGLGLPPKYFDVLLGKKVNRAVSKGTPVAWDLLG